MGDRVPSMSVVTAQYVRQLRSHPASFHSAVWVCAKGMIDKTSVNRSTLKQRRILDLCYQISLRSTIEMISSLSDETSKDELGMLCSTMQALALGTTEESPERAARSGPRQSTVTKLQNLHIWGLAPRWLNDHEEAARKILHENDCPGPFWAGLRVCQTQ
jgi:hypothetical protein